MKEAIYTHFEQQLDEIQQAGLYKAERLIQSPQRGQIELTDGRSVLNLCANNYLGLAEHPEVVAAAKQGLDEFGYGLASVRFICGTQTQHKALESAISQFLETEDTILYPSCFDANGGLFETLLGAEDAVISDALNHASIIDGVRLCKAKRYRYQNNNMQDLEAQLQGAERDGARIKLITTDGVFSMDGSIAKLSEICDLAERYQALVHVDDCHATGFLGANGKGSHEHCGVLGRVDILTGTLGKALGGASGGYTSGRRPVIHLLRQRSRPYLFSNSVPPPVVAASLKALALARDARELRQKLEDNTQFFRRALSDLGFDLLPGEHPIVPVMLYDARIAVSFAERMLQHGVYVVAFSYPVVPKGQARIRTQVSAALSRKALQRAVDAFAEVKRELGL